MSKELPSLRIGEYESRFCIVQGGMSVGLTGAKLAAAVANEGGFGTIGGVGLGMSPEIRTREDYFKANELTLTKEIRSALEMSNNGNIGVNLMVAATDYEQMVEVAVKNEVKFIVSGAGLPYSLPEYVKKYAANHKKPEPELIPIVSSVRALDIILRKSKKSGFWPAAVVVETPNTAGGHLGVTKVEDIGKYEFSLEKVVPEMVEYLKNSGHEIPVIAAGGIWDRVDIDKMLDIGAGGVQMATRFLGTVECNDSLEFKERHINNKDPIVVIKSPVGMPGRAVDNKFIQEVKSGRIPDLEPCFGCLQKCGYCESGFETDYCIIRSLVEVRNGNPENGVLFTGTNGFRLREDVEKYGTVTVRHIMQELTQ